MKTKKSNLIFLSYIGVIFLVAVGLMIYLKSVFTDEDFTINNRTNSFVNVEVDNQNLKSVQDFNVVVLKNVDDISLIQQDSFAVDIPDSSMILRNDTLFVENCNNAQISFISVSTIIANENTSLNLVADNQNELKIISQDAEINLAALELNRLELISTGNSDISLAGSQIQTVYIDMKGQNDVSFVAKINLLEGNNSEETSLSMIPRPKNVNLNKN